MAIRAIILALAIACGLTRLAFGQPIVTVAPVPGDAWNYRVLMGSCIAGDRSIEMTQVLFLENRSVTVLDPARRPLRLRIEGERLILESDHPLLGRTQETRRIDRQITEESDLDIELKFAWVEDALALYWRETFQHRIYRQGLMRVEGDALTPLCEGRAGQTSSH